VVHKVGSPNTTESRQDQRSGTKNYEAQKGVEMEKEN
jgi:hypothetical protein